MKKIIGIGIGLIALLLIGLHFKSSFEVYQEARRIREETIENWDVGDEVLHPTSNEIATEIISQLHIGNNSGEKETAFYTIYENESTIYISLNTYWTYGGHIAPLDSVTFVDASLIEGNIHASCMPNCTVNDYKSEDNAWTLEFVDGPPWYLEFHVRGTKKFIKLWFSTFHLYTDSWEAICKYYDTFEY